MKHQFALYVESLSQEPGLLRPGSSFVISDSELIHRITTVLRLQQSDEIILFDSTGHAFVTIKDLSKKRIVCSVQSYQKNQVLEPAITVLLPLLRREAFEEAVYSTVELGASAVQPVITAKAQRSWGGAKEKERVHRIMIAAAEQSKNFSLPTLHDPVELAQAVEEVSALPTKLFFDPTGSPLIPLLHTLQEKPTAVACMIGPEGDLLEDEKALLKKNKFQFAALTPTILRAQQALVVGLGALRLIGRA